MVGGLPCIKLHQTPPSNGLKFDPSLSCPGVCPKFYASVPVWSFPGLAVVGSFLIRGMSEKPVLGGRFLEI